MRLPLLPLARSPRRHDAPAPLPSSRVALPHFARSNGQLRASPRRREAPAALQTPVELLVDDVRLVTSKIRESFGRMSQTQDQFELEDAQLRARIAQLRTEQIQIADAYVALFQHSALEIQRVFRGYLARKVYREALALRAVLRIQRAFRAEQARRAERRRKFRIISRKILRGMRGIRARQQLTHNELLSRVSHNMMIERQWRLAMGIADTESDLIHALYRRKFVRQRIGAAFRKAVALHAIVGYWQRIVPARIMDAGVSETEEQVEESTRVEEIDVEIVPPEETSQHCDSDVTDTKPSLFSITQQLASPSRSTQSPRKQSRVTQEELRRRQKLYTQRVYEENLKKEAVRAAQLEKQRVAARIAEETRKQLEEEQRRLRFEQAQALRDDLERRGLLAIKELQSRKEEELRKEEEAQMRIAQAKQRIAQEVLSGETQLLLSRKNRDAANKRSKKSEIN